MTDNNSPKVRPKTHGVRSFALGVWALLYSLAQDLQDIHPESSKRLVEIADVLQQEFDDEKDPPLESTPPVEFDEALEQLGISSINTPASLLLALQILFAQGVKLRAAFMSTEQNEYGDSVDRWRLVVDCRDLKWHTDGRR